MVRVVWVYGVVGLFGVVWTVGVVGLVDRVVGLVVVVEVVEVVVRVGLVEVVGSRIFLNGCNELSIVQCLDAVLTSALFNLERKHFYLENNT